jgi:hypothetical protein
VVNSQDSGYKKGDCSPNYSMLLKTAVTIESNIGRSCGTIFNKNGHNYIISCGHGVQKVGDKIKATQFVKDSFNLDHEKVFHGKVLGHSPEEELKGFDVGVFGLSTKIKFPKVEFTEEVPQIGETIYHVGTPYGYLHAAFLKGTVASLNKFDDLEDHEFIIVDLEARPGCSGGGVYIIRDNKFLFCGILVRGDGHGLSYVKPYSVLKDLINKNTNGK